MEKKTMGKFISVLRKANGMTQQELADKLLVSDKTVSKWERDERMPDISLLPAIAEIFGITTDELLRGERNNPEREGHGTEETEAKQTAKSEKQFNNMLEQQKKKYNSQICITSTLLFLGCIIGLILAFTVWDVCLPISCAFFGIIAQGCQLAFANHAIVRSDEDNGNLQKIGKYNKHIVLSTTCFTIVNISAMLIAGFACYALESGNIGWALLAMILVPQVLYATYALAVREFFVKRGFIVDAEQQEKILKKNNEVLKKMFIAFAVTSAVFAVVGFVVIEFCIDFWKPTMTFDSVDSFKEYVESEYDEYAEGMKEVYWMEDESGNWYFRQEDYDEFCAECKEERTLTTEDGKIICEYYCLSGAYGKATYEINKKGQTVIGILTWEEEWLANNAYFNCLTNELPLMLFVYLIIPVILYPILAYVNKKKVLTGADENKAEKPELDELAAE